MKIFFVAPEATPYVKTGGLGDVTGTLPKYLKDLGVVISLILPFYKIIKEKKIPLNKVFSSAFSLNGNNFFYSVYKNNDNSEFDTYFIENDDLFFRDGIYSKKGIDYLDNYIRYSFFSLASLKYIFESGDCDVIHIHDWQTSLIPVYKKIYYPKREEKVLLTIHNIAYQGIFNKEILKEIDLPESVFNIEGLEFYGNVNFLKGGIVFSDFINTVSSSYGKEIQKEEFGFGLHNLLLKRRECITGIINGIDYSYWNPEIDKYIKVPFALETIDKKRENKNFLYEELGVSFDLEKPLFSIISRITSQKGFDILFEGFEELMKLPLNLIILGTGDIEDEKELKKFGEIYKEKFIPIIKFDEELSHKIYASSNFFLMPSKFEPCGLGQLIALRYGAVPLVRRTGGLKDTIQNYHEKTNCGNGITFDNYNSFELLEAIKRAAKIFENKKVYKKIQESGMKCDYSWRSSSKEYLRLYNKIKEE